MLAPFHHFVPAGLDDVSPDPITVLSHSLRQLDRIDSLSEQISFLEERLETCEWQEECQGEAFPNQRGKGLSLQAIANCCTLALLL